MKKIFSFCNQKGGVGKTTSAVNIATCIAKSGKRVLLLDMDAQANATSGVGEEKPSIEFTTYQLIVDNIDPHSLIRKTSIENLDLIPSNADLSGAEVELVNRERREFILNEELMKFHREYDVIFIDCPPSLGLITINALVASDYLIIPLQCEYYALEGLGQLLNSFHLVQKNLNADLEIGGVILTMADFRTNLTQQVIEEVKNYFKGKVFGSIIPRSVRLSEAPSFGKPAVIYDPSSRGSKAYQDVAAEFSKRFLESASGETASQETEASGETSAEETSPEEIHPNQESEAKKNQSDENESVQSNIREGNEGETK